MSLKYEPASEPLHIKLVPLHSEADLEKRAIRLDNSRVFPPQTQHVPKLTDLYRTPSMST